MFVFVCVCVCLCLVSYCLTINFERSVELFNAAVSVDVKPMMNQTSTFETHTFTSQATISSCTIWIILPLLPEFGWSNISRHIEFLPVTWYTELRIFWAKSCTFLMMVTFATCCGRLLYTISINKDAFRLTLDGYNNDKYLRYALKDDDTIYQTIVNWINLQFCPPSRQLQDINVNPTPETTLQTPSISIPSLQQTSGQRDQHLSAPVFICPRSTRFTRCSP